MVTGHQAKVQGRKAHNKRAQAFSLIEVVSSMAVMGIMITALYAGVAWCFKQVGNARENLRATQVMIEKMEVVRLLTWDQLTTNNILPTTFTAPYVTRTPTGKKETNSVSLGFTYYGTINVLAPLDTQLMADYTNDLRVVNVQVFWTNQGVPHSRKISTYVSRYGLQNYAIN